MLDVLSHCNQLTIDGFLPHFEALRQYADRAVYQDIESEVDGVTYPGISTHLPEPVVDDVVKALRDVVGDVQVNTIFMRLTTEGTLAPHQAHTDSVMGKGSLMVYLTPDEYCEGGTAFVRHKDTGMFMDPQTEHEFTVWERDVNESGAWETVEVCEMKQNRACIFHAGRMHRAHPIGGFGNNAADGRLVLTAFFE